jgi:hypothetical protein
VEQARPDRHPAVDCGPLATERNRYFTGKSMTARDFTDEQRYFLDRHRTHNRLLHGWGVVCGLAVKYHHLPDCQERWVVVRKGIAIDCCGRELILPDDRAVRLDQASPGAKDWRPPPGGLLVALEYEEQQVEPMPVLYHEGACDPTRSEASRVREVAKIRVVPFDPEKWPNCWRRQDQPQEGGPCEKGCDDPVPAPAWGCLSPHCPCGGLVPLALITSDPDYRDDRYPQARFRIDDSGVWRLPPPPEYLTRITNLNWTHGGTLSVRELERQGRTLKVWFDRPLRPKDEDSTGINRFTFIVQYGNVQEDLEFLASHEEPWFDEEHCVASFTLDDRYFAARRPTIAGSDIFVTLKCDFLLDCHGLAVDGDHLRGHLPSGNGVEGGTFESWFRITNGETGKES